jgi:hypothetical protein
MGVRRHNRNRAGAHQSTRRRAPLQLLGRHRSCSRGRSCDACGWAGASVQARACSCVCQTRSQLRSATETAVAPPPAQTPKTAAPSPYLVRLEGQHRGPVWQRHGAVSLRLTLTPVGRVQHTQGSRQLLTAWPQSVIRAVDLTPGQRLRGWTWAAKVRSSHAAVITPPPTSSAPPHAVIQREHASRKHPLHKTFHPPLAGAANARAGANGKQSLDAALHTTRSTLVHRQPAGANPSTAEQQRTTHHPTQNTHQHASAAPAAAQQAT